MIFAGREQYRLFSLQQEISARPSGALRHSGFLPVVGDWVQAEDGIIRTILPRRTKFSRRVAGKRQDEQVIAANIDVVFIVCGLDNDYNPRRIERYLVLAHESGAAPVVVLNKCDLREPPPSDFGAPAIAISARAPDGVAPLGKWIEPGQTVAFLGSSGAGKSTILNALLGRNRQQTGQVREHDSRGRHTTTSHELFELPCGAFAIDTPGMRELRLWADEISVDVAFDDIADLAAHCRFSDCRHHGEPGCAVAAALDQVDLQPDRWTSYQKLRSEAQTLDKKQLKKLHLAMRHRPKWL